MTSSPENLAALKGRFSVKIARVMGRLGLNRDEERALRKNHLVKGADWEEVGTSVRYSAEAVEKLAGLVGGSSQKKAAPCAGLEAGCAGGVEGGDTRGEMVLGQPGAKNGEKRAALLLPLRCAPGEPVLMTVCRGAGLMNLGVIECFILGSVTKVTVRVRSNEHFLPGMLVWGQREGEVWWFRGDGNKPPSAEARGPRWRGKW